MLHPVLGILLYNLGGLLGGSNEENDDIDDEDESDQAPGAYPTPDNQGNLEVCTRYAIAKAIIDGFMRRIFVRGKEVDLDQKTVTTGLLNVHKNGDPQWPTAFNGTSYQFFDEQARHWRVDLRVHKMTGVEDFKRDVSNSHRVYTWILVYLLNPNYPKGPKHCVYAEDYDPDHGEVMCINSDPTYPYPKIPINDPGNTLYRICCTATEMTSSPHPPPLLSTSSTSSSVASPAASASSPQPFTQDKPPPPRKSTPVQGPPPVIRRIRDALKKKRYIW